MLLIVYICLLSTMMMIFSLMSYKIRGLLRCLPHVNAIKCFLCFPTLAIPLFWHINHLMRLRKHFSDIWEFSLWLLMRYWVLQKTVDIYQCPSWHHKGSISRFNLQQFWEHFRACFMFCVGPLGCFNFPLVCSRQRNTFLCFLTGFPSNFLEAILTLALQHRDTSQWSDTRRREKLVNRCEGRLLTFSAAVNSPLPSSSSSVE